ncbi:MAG: hypothetical protein H6618_07540 [Deltaproteobacteria bacterium]|nr:hypothetical protein [Deltaproteobacteria bacterium]
MRNPQSCHRTILTLMIILSWSGPLWGAQKDWLLSLPLVSLGRESLLGVEFNIMNDFSLGAHLGLLSEGEELRKKELEQQPGNSLRMSGQDFSIIFQRFSNPEELSGFHWGLSAGYRSIRGTWVRNPEYRSGSEFYPDQDGKIRQFPELTGTSLGFRSGYRFIAESSGLMAGIYLRLRHFQNRVKEQTKQNSSVSGSPISHEDAIALKRRMMTSLLGGIEVGWAF